MPERRPCSTAKARVLDLLRRHYQRTHRLIYAAPNLMVLYPAANLLAPNFSHNLARRRAPRQAIARASSGIRTSSLSFKPMVIAVRTSVVWMGRRSAWRRKTMLDVLVRQPLGIGLDDLPKRHGKPRKVQQSDPLVQAGTAPSPLRNNDSVPCSVVCCGHRETRSSKRCLSKWCRENCVDSVTPMKSLTLRFLAKARGFDAVATYAQRVSAVKLGCP